jgi:hypothetical protein
MRRNPRFLLISLQLDEPETRVAISIALRARAMLGM